MSSPIQKQGNPSEHAQKTLIAIDGNSLLHRAFHALPPMTTADGTPTGALHGFLSMLLKLVAREPDYLAVAFDVHGPTFRHEKYELYKAGRKETPDELRAQFPLLKSLLKSMGVRVCECPRYEADDILGTLSRRAEEAGVSALLVTGDRDALQLVGESTHVLLTKKGISETVEYDVAQLLADYGLAPGRMRDLKALMGDSSDHIPGIPGVGEKTAQKLLAEYETLDGVLAHAEAIKGKLGERVREGEASARLSFWLGTIDRDAPVSETLADCVFTPETMAGAREELLRLELRGIAAKLPAGKSAATEPQLTACDAECVDIETEEALLAAAKAGEDAKSLALCFDGQLSFAFSPERIYRIRQGADLFASCIEPAAVFSALAPLIRSVRVEKLVFDAKALRHVLSRQSIALSGPVFDAMIADYLINAIRPAGSFAALSERRFFTSDAHAAQLFSLRDTMNAELAQADMSALYSRMEAPLADLLFEMEQTGFRVDEAMLLHLQNEFGARIQTLSDEIFELVGERFQILSPKQLGEILFGKLGLAAQKKTKSGYSTDADTLERLKDGHPVVPLILEYRFLYKLKSSFVDGLLSARAPSDGRVRTRFNQCVTATGRISSTEPNLQNIPVRTELGREIRRAFIASPGNVLVGADYSQIELRLLAHISGDARMIAAFASGADIHSQTASEVFGVPPVEVTGEMRSAAKAVNFGIVYGISSYGLSSNLNIPVKEAASYIDNYLARYTGVKRYMEESVALGRERGYAETLFHRRRALPELSSGNYNTRAFGERVAMNMPIQGSAADIIKLAMVRVHEALQRGGYRARLVLQIHDELIVDCPTAEAAAVSRLVREAMEGVLALSVPLVAEVRQGKSWYDTK